jgi:phosphomannomutase
MINEIKFSTAGLRGIIAESITAQNIERLCVAIAEHIFTDAYYGFEGEGYRKHIAQRGLKFKRPLVIVGHDTRFMSDKFADIACNALISKGISVKRAVYPLPTPAAEWSVLNYGAIGAVVITASEADYTQNGLKWISYYGGIANNEVVGSIEKNIPSVSSLSKTLPEFGYQNSAAATQNLRDEYLSHLNRIINVKAIKKSKLKVGIDPLFGTAAQYMRKFLTSCGVQVEAINENSDVLFGGKTPNAGPESLKDLSALVVKKKLHLGIACNSDCDKFGIIGPDGAWLSPNQVAPLILEHLIKNRKASGRICRSIITTTLIDEVAKAHNMPVRETPVGFKYIGELMTSGQYIFGTEESGGIAISNHIPDKDGFLAGILLLEMIAVEGKPLKQILKSFYKKYNAYYDKKVSIPKREIEIVQIMEKLNLNPPLSLNKTSVWRIDQTDGFKFILRNGNWLALRPSGTEHLIRVYAEAKDPQTPAKLIAEAQKIIAALSS